jgi:hypothetical protein
MTAIGNDVVNHKIGSEAVFNFLTRIVFSFSFCNTQNHGFEISKINQSKVSLMNNYALEFPLSKNK